MGPHRLRGESPVLSPSVRARERLDKWIRTMMRDGSKSIGKLRSAVFQNEGLLKVWIWCFSGRTTRSLGFDQTGRGSTQVFVKRGQFIFGRKTAAKALKMPERTVHKRMLKLENMQNCDIQSDTHFSIVTILNYELYQGTKIRKGQAIITGRACQSMILKVAQKGTPKVTPKTRY